MVCPFMKNFVVISSRLLSLYVYLFSCLSGTSHFIEIEISLTIFRSNFDVRFASHLLKWEQTSAEC
jgi:hypothetical protein